jgi:DNA polymerase
MPEPHASTDPKRELRSIARSVHMRLEGDGRAGLTAVPKPTAEPAKRNGGHSLPAAAGSVVAADAQQRPDATERVPPETPESRAAATLKRELEDRVPAVARTGELFGLADGGEPDGISRADGLARIAAEVAACELCPELAAGRMHTVPGQGSPYAQLVFVGEGPGEEEDRQGLAFVGRAGELLTKMIESIGMTRDQVFIANIVKCRPPQNRLPMPDEEANCSPYLMRQLEILRPKVICALGGTAAKWLLQTHDGITRLRGRFYPYRGVLLMPTFHPAYVLRNYTPDTRKKVYEDLLKVKAELAK